MNALRQNYKVHENLGLSRYVTNLQTRANKERRETL